MEQSTEIDLDTLFDLADDQSVQDQPRMFVMTPWCRHIMEKANRFGTAYVLKELAFDDVNPHHLSRRRRRRQRPRMKAFALAQLSTQ